MFIYDKKENSIDIYSIEAKKEALKNFRKSVIQKHKNEDLFYCLETNSEETIKQFNVARSIDIRLLDYNHIDFLDHRLWSSITQLHPKKYILERYIDGEYDELVPTKTFEFIWKDDLICEIHHLIKPEVEKVVFQNTHGKVWEINNMINLPRNLYLLQLLLQGRFEDLTSEDISRQLQLFDINYLKNIKLDNIREILETGLVRGTIEDTINKAEIGSKILKKAKKKNF